jgi:hypothetical protein
MKWVLFVLGLLIGAAGMFAAVTRFAPANAHSPDDDQIVFAAKVFSQGPTWVAISGTLTGEHLGYPNNTYSVACYQDINGCIVNSIEQIGHNQIGRLDVPVIYSVVKWNADEVVAESGASEIMCTKLTLTIERKYETLLWVEEPINQSRPMCKHASATVAKYTIEDSPGWKKIFGKK